jgi:hypothetical protein
VVVSDNSTLTFVNGLSISNCLEKLPLLQKKTFGTVHAQEVRSLLGVLVAIHPRHNLDQWKNLITQLGHDYHSACMHHQKGFCGVQDCSHCALPLDVFVDPVDHGWNARLWRMLDNLHVPFPGLEFWRRKLIPSLCSWPFPHIIHERTEVQLQIVSMFSAFSSILSIVFYVFCVSVFFCLKENTSFSLQTTALQRFSRLRAAWIQACI